ncbi:dethiobiotin synthase [Castellaniella ginsengisoli]|uniref:ATP-dependent dethiobiotin synthetase BioD n=1 Tax=Castellaniella ginsengisoli TaxID=546114 RepID=A0AB39CVS8_9BURK
MNVPATGMEACPGVFVTGTDTDVGKTLVSAILAKAWGADYWKPYQTGVASLPGDTETVAALLGPEGGHVLHAPACVLQAPLAPWAAARAEGVTLEMAGLRPPRTAAPLVVEGAGGLYVPVDDDHMMIDLAARLALPVVLVARSTLGTINHTLLSLRALRAQALPVMGVVMNGPPSPGNREALERFGQVPVIAEIPRLERVDAASVAVAAARIPALAVLARAVRSAG